MTDAVGFETAAYLRRIGHRGSAAPVAATLRALHLAHLRTVPFENLDVWLGRPIQLEEGALFDKIVRRRRGGFCYELNGLFAVLLRALGFEVSLLAARFPREAGHAAPDLDHLALLVRVPGEEGSWLADVGAGRGSFAAPLRTECDEETWQPERTFGWRGRGSGGGCSGGSRGAGGRGSTRSPRSVAPSPILARVAASTRPRPTRRSPGGGSVRSRPRPGG